MHARIAEDRVHPQAVIGDDRPRHRLLQSAALAADARGLEPLRSAVARPLHQLQVAAAVAVEAGIEQLSALDLAGGGAAMLDDDVEPVVRIEAGRDADLAWSARGYRIRPAARARRRRGPNGRGSRRRGPGCAAASRRPRSGSASSARTPLTPRHLDAKVEPGAEARACRAAGPPSGSAGGPASGPRSCPGGCRRSARTSPIMVAIRSASAPATPARSSTPGEAVAAAQGRAQVDDRPLGRFRQRLDGVGRRHAAAGVGAEGERRDGERADFLELGVGEAAAPRRPARPPSKARATRPRSRARRR